MIPPIAPNSAAKTAIALPDIPAMTLNAAHVHLLNTDGEIKTLTHDQAKAVTHKSAVMLCHAPYIRAQLGQDTQIAAFDVLELFAFTHPGRFATPTINGLCKTLGLPAPQDGEDAPITLIEIARALLSDLQNDPHKAKADPIEIARTMGLNGKGWPWTPFVFATLGQNYDPAIPVNSKTGLNIWKNLPEWAEEAPLPPPSHHAVTAQETKERLQKLLGHDAEERQPQKYYALAIGKAFDTPQSNNTQEAENNTDPASTLQPPTSNRPHIVLAEAGTGVGKTLGYLAPASIWAEKNQGSVWISTYTKNLQRQIDQELSRLYPTPALKNAHIAVRKGRENYLCLLNLEETAASAALAKHPNAVIAAGIMARWAAASKDGDLSGGQYPGWLTGLLGYQHSAGLADRRGECVYSACDHYRKCFVEHSVRRAKSARIVVANHALVMITSALATPGEDLPARYIFDEGHHLFDAADSAFAAHLSARETRDLRRWILGNEGGRRGSRARGLKRRAEDLAEGMPEAEEALRKILTAAECLPMDGWTRRLKQGAPSGPAETFMAAIYAQVHARANGREGPYSLETEVFPVDNNLRETAQNLGKALKALQNPMQNLAKAFYKKIADAQTQDGNTLDSDTRKRLESAASSIDRRASMTIKAWIDMLFTLHCHPVGNAEGVSHERDPQKRSAESAAHMDPR
ncbi:MAG: ATP-dependent DNA helicase, partial [Bdellovibrionales bacterium]